jgi:hypothetical protein
MRSSGRTPTRETHPATDLAALDAPACGRVVHTALSDADEVGGLASGHFIVQTDGRFRFWASGSSRFGCEACGDTTRGFRFQQFAEELQRVGMTRRQLAPVNLADTSRTLEVPDVVGDAGHAAQQRAKRHQPGPASPLRNRSASETRTNASTLTWNSRTFRCSSSVSGYGVASLPS